MRTTGRNTSPPCDQVPGDRSHQRAEGHARIDNICCHDAGANGLRHVHTEYEERYGSMPGETLHQYQRNLYLSRLDERGIAILHHHELALDGDAPTLRHIFSGERRALPDVATLVLAQGRVPADELWAQLESHPAATRVGDVLGPRTLEEAVLEGTLAGAGAAGRRLMAERIGGHLVAESMAALGAEVAFGVPGVHSLAIWEGLRAGPIEVYGTRTELCAGFAADGYARSSGKPCPAAALHRARRAELADRAHGGGQLARAGDRDLQPGPVDLVGAGRGYLHELPDQLASFRPLVKHAVRAGSAMPSLNCWPGPGRWRSRRPVARCTSRSRSICSVPRSARRRSPPSGGPAEPRRALRLARRRRPAAATRRAAGHLGRRRRDPRRRRARAARPGRAARRTGGDHLHGQGRAR